MNSSAHRAPDPVHHTILVPLDGSHFADGALPTARALAARFGATVHTVTVAVSDWRAGAHPRRSSARARHRPRRPAHPRRGRHRRRRRRPALRLRSSTPAWCACRPTGGDASPARCSDRRRATSSNAAARQSSSPVPVVDPDPEDETATPPLDVDHLVACVDGTPGSERGLPVAAAWAHALGMRLTIVTVAEPCPPPVRIGAPWRRQHGPNEDADDYVRRLREQWALEAPGLETFVVYDPISAADGMKDYLAAHPTGLIAVTSHLRDPLARLVLGSGAADIVHTSTAPVLVVPAPAVEA